MPAKVTVISQQLAVWM